MNMQSAHQHLSDFPSKMSSLSEVQRIIGLSLSKIQLGRNQRGGLPLHKNLLVATVLNKARDLYMQETMYMNYKMMTGQYHQHHPMSSYTSEFALNGGSAMGSQGASHASTSQAREEEDNDDDEEEEEDDMEANTASPEDYEEDNEDSDHSDVEDDSATTPRSQGTTSSGATLNPSTTVSANAVPQQSQHDMSLMFQQHHQQLLLHQHQMMMQQFQQQQQQLQQQQQMQAAVEAAAAAAAAAAANASSSSSSSSSNAAIASSNAPGGSTSASSSSTAASSTAANNDEGFIDEPDCDCDARNNFSNDAKASHDSPLPSTSSSSSGLSQSSASSLNNSGNSSDDEDGSRTPPFQYCYNCAPFHASNGRGPTLVPSPPRSQTPMSSQLLGGGGGSSAGDLEHPARGGEFTLYNMDSKSNENLSPDSSVVVQAGCKRRWPSSNSYEEDEADDFGEADEDCESPSTSKRRRSSGCEESSSPNGSLNESGYLSPGDQSFSTSPSQVFQNHPAFRSVPITSASSQLMGLQCEEPTTSHASMEIDQITSLVSIFSFGQQIMAAAAVQKQHQQQQQQQAQQQKHLEKESSLKAAAAATAIATPSESSQLSPVQTESASTSSPPSASSPSVSTPPKPVKTEKAPRGTGNDDDSDSESDTSSDSGHSSDDHDVSSDDKPDSKDTDGSSVVVGITKLSRSPSTPDLKCGVEVVLKEVETGGSPGSPPCLGLPAV